MEVTARVFFSKTTNINLASPTSTFSHLHSDDVHAVGGLSDFTTRCPFLESSDNFSGPKSCSMFAVFAFKMTLTNFENNKVKSSGFTLNAKAFHGNGARTKDLDRAFSTRFYEV